MSDDLMIEVANLTKRYAGRTAVSDISFEVRRGEIVGLLGPNGAGKSTTMRILACFLAATSGTIRVGGLDVFRQSDEVRRRIGYMPEKFRSRGTSVPRRSRYSFIWAKPRSIVARKPTSRRRYPTAQSRTPKLLATMMIFLVGCNVSTVLSAAPGSPTASAADMATQVKETAAAAATETAALITPTITSTSTEAPTSTPTMTPTITLTPFLGAFPGDLDCKVRSQSMTNGTHVDARTRFDVGWKVKNTCTATWDPSNTDFVYVSGTRMYQADALDLPTVVGPGDVIALSAALLSPKHPGTYMTVWALRRGENHFCRVSVEIIVP